MDMEPKTRREHFLAKIAGNPYDSTILPKTREEFFLNDIAESGGGSGGSSLLEEQTAVLLPETTMTFAVPVGTTSGSGDVADPQFTMASTPVNPISFEFEPTGARVIVDGGAPQEAVLSMSNGPDIGNPNASWVLEIRQVAVESPSDTSTVSYYLDVFYVGEDFAEFVGEHTVGALLYATAPSAAFTEAYQLASGGDGGDGGLFIVTVTTSGSTLVADKTVADILYALASGKIPVAIEARDENGFTAHSAYYFVDSTSTSATFRRMSCSSSGVYGTDLSINPLGVRKDALAYSPGK